MKSPAIIRKPVVIQNAFHCSWRYAVLSKLASINRNNANIIRLTFLSCILKFMAYTQLSHRIVLDIQGVSL